MALFGIGPAPRDRRVILTLLEERGLLRCVTAPVDPDLELAAIADLREGSGCETLNQERRRR